MNRGFPSFVRTIENPAGTALDPPPEVIFHHLPKTAGSTFRRILESLFEPREICPGEIDDEIRQLPPAERARYRLYAGHFSYEMIAAAFPDAVWLTFLRQPIPRVISNYYNLTRPQRHTAQWRRRVAARPAVQRFVDRVAGMTLREFVHLDDPRARDRVINRQTRYLVSGCPDPFDGGGEEAACFPVYDPAIVAEAKRNLRQRFAFVGIQEHFDLSLQLFAMTFGL
ncbi:MAG: sulfotransferase family 2 domain-containing protein, partial [Planctomycetota bacterium]